MILAAFGDVHGNLPALDAVLRDIDERGIQTVVNTGDSVVGRSWPNEVIELLRRRNIPSVQGEWDRRTVLFQRKKTTLRERFTPSEIAAMRETYEACESENLEYLRGLPRVLRLTVDGISVAVCHGTLSSQTTGLGPDAPEDRFLRQREIAPVDIIVCGQTHEPFARDVAGTLFVNPGSAGMFTEDPPVARYAVVSTESDPWEVDFRSVPYTLPETA